MNVLVDTSVWSLALRRVEARDDSFSRELADLVREGRVVMLGPIRQELLSGVRSDKQFTTVRDHLRAFPDQEITTSDYESAAGLFNRCRRRGIRGSNIDFLICAVGARLGTPVLTTDGDFKAFAKVLPIRLHKPRG